jgi:cytoskeletal protein CcmA (bactofilin family)
MNFLVVDDDRDLNDSLTGLFRAKGHAASSLTDATAVEVWVKNNPCDAVVLDLGMPKINGLSLIHIIRDQRPNLPIIIFTGFGDDKDLMDATSYAGANGYVSKSQGLDEIYSAVIRELAKPKDSSQKPQPGPGIIPNGKSMIQQDVEVSGSIKFKGEMVFGGKLKKGSLTGDLLEVGKDARIKGDITADVLILTGKVTGNVTAMQTCELTASAEVIGDLTANRLSMEEGATLVGQVRLGPKAGNGSDA